MIPTADVYEEATTGDTITVYEATHLPVLMGEGEGNTKAQNRRLPNGNSLGLQRFRRQCFPMGYPWSSSRQLPGATLRRVRRCPSARPAAAGRDFRARWRPRTRYGTGRGGGVPG